MSRVALAIVLTVLVCGSARAQVEVAPLAAPDAFSTPGRQTGLPPDLWRGTPLELARTVLARLATRPVSPAAAEVARRLLATGATGPEGSRGDEELLGARASALIALGDVGAAARILDRAPGLERNPALAQAAAESALLAGDEDRACAVAAALGAGRGDIYWLRLRAFCQAVAGQGDQAQLTFDLAQAQTRDVIYGRLMSARLSGTPAGPASLRNGLDLALSRALKLELGAAKAAPAVAAAMSGVEPAPPAYAADGLDVTLSDRLAAAETADSKSRTRLQGLALLSMALAVEVSGPERVRLSAFAVPEGKAPLGRGLALEAAAATRRMGEAVLLALWTFSEAGPEGPALGDRVRIVSALTRAGLPAEARLIALEGAAGLK